MQRIISALLFIVIFSGSSFLQAQSAQEIRLDQNAVFFVDGTSTLHDWTVESDKATGIIKLTESTIESVTVQVPAQSLESGKSGMDRRMHDALNVRRHNQITFTSNQITLNESKSGGVAAGELTIAGKKQPFEVSFVVEENGSSWKFTGSSTFKMSQFDVDPPTAVMGTIRSGDEVTVRFEINSSKPLFVRAQ